MKAERTYPIYTVNKHAEGLLVGGHPWVYENDIPLPRRPNPKTARWPMWSAQKVPTSAPVSSRSRAKFACG